ARRKVDEERLVGRRRLLLRHPANRAVSEGLGQMPRRIVVRPLDRRRVLEQRREPLVRLAALEPGPRVETLAGGPAIVRASGAELVVGRVVPFAERGRGVVVAL